jgi:hypothetical protein
MRRTMSPTSCCKYEQFVIYQSTKEIEKITNIVQNKLVMQSIGK